MKFYGHANMQQNEVQNAVLTTLTQFPEDPKIGQIAFVNSIVYICLTAGSLPVWIPLTREITAYTHTQTSAAATWNITHSLNTTSVNVQIYDSANRVVIPEAIETTGSTTVVVNFGTPATGRAVVVSGHFDGQLKAMYAYTHFQSSAATTWTIVHNLGYNPITRVFIGNQEVQPASITHTNTNTTVITFNTAQVGYARMI